MDVAEKILRGKADLDAVYDAGYAKGQAEGGGGDTDEAWDDGFDAGYESGYADGEGSGYFNGLDVGREEGLAEGIEQGKQAGEDAMWDLVQNYGNRTDYRYFIFYSGFTHLDPKWAAKPTYADSIMGNNDKLETVNWEKFDLTATSTLYNAFGFCYRLTAVDTDLCLVNGTATALNSIFRNCYALQRVKKITAIPEAVWKQSFDNCTELTHIIFDGTIGANGLNLQWSTKLSKESIDSIVECLSPATSGLSITLSKTAVDAISAAEQEDYGDYLSSLKPNWTIILV